MAEQPTETELQVIALLETICMEHRCTGPGCTHRNHPRDADRLSDHLAMLGLDKYGKQQEGRQAC